MMSDFEPLPGERTLRSWAARSPGAAANRSVSGNLILTDRRLLCVTKGGLFGRSRSPGTDRSLLLEEVGGAAPHRSEMRIGYGDRMILEGVEISGAVYELGREAPSRAILTEIGAARQARRKELGLPEDIAPCRSCGRWIPVGSTLCASCAGPRKGSS
jgi:hypothetical protein